jgi:aspartate kinase
MALIVQKFGGTSVADVMRIQKVAKIILKEYKADHKLVIVVSAMAGTTNSLISRCNEVSQLNAYNHMQEYDAVVGSGEILTAGLVALELQRLGLKARSVQGWQIPILTNDAFANAKVESINSEFIHNLINEDIIPVITGFQGVTINGQITTLGKGGSDTTAALVAAAIGADRADIYTDVLGVFTADPRVIHDASKIDCISAEQMLILSSYGAKVLHPRAALAAARYKFEMRILSSFDDKEGTLISSKIFDMRPNNMENRLITAITSNKNIIQIEITCSSNSFSEVIKKFTEEGLIVDKVEIHDSNKISLMASLADKNKFEAI